MKNFLIIWGSIPVESDVPPNPDLIDKDAAGFRVQYPNSNIDKSAELNLSNISDGWTGYSDAIARTYIIYNSEGSFNWETHRVAFDIEFAFFATTDRYISIIPIQIIGDKTSEGVVATGPMLYGKAAPYWEHRLLNAALEDQKYLGGSGTMVRIVGTLTKSGNDLLVACSSIKVDGAEKGAKSWTEINRLSSIAVNAVGLRLATTSAVSRAFSYVQHSLVIESIP